MAPIAAPGSDDARTRIATTVFATGTYEQRDAGGNVVATGQFEFSE